MSAIAPLFLHRVVGRYHSSLIHKHLVYIRIQADTNGRKLNPALTSLALPNPGWFWYINMHSIIYFNKDFLIQTKFCKKN
jgi:hypothetical protein